MEAVKAETGCGTALLDAGPDPDRGVGGRVPDPGALPSGEPLEEAGRTLALWPSCTKTSLLVSWQAAVAACLCTLAQLVSSPMLKSPMRRALGTGSSIRSILETHDCAVAQSTRICPEAALRLNLIPTSTQHREVTGEAGAVLGPRQVLLPHAVLRAARAAGLVAPACSSPIWHPGMSRTAASPTRRSRSTCGHAWGSA